MTAAGLGGFDGRRVLNTVVGLAGGNKVWIRADLKRIGKGKRKGLSERRHGSKRTEIGVKTQFI